MRSVLLLAALGAVLALPSAASAQVGTCQLIENEYSERRIEGGFAVIFIQGPLLVRCDGGAEIRSAVGTLYEASREIHLSGNVSFRDPERRLTSLQATYSSVTGQLYATGNVVFTDLTEGMTLSGPELEYYRAMPGRPEPQAIATQRPHLTLQPRGRAGAPPPEDAEPIEIDADRMTMFGNDHFTAIGRVEIRRSDFEAFSNEARVDQVNEHMELRGNARIEAEQFDLTGEQIDIATPGDQLERIVAQRDAVLAGEDLRIDAAELHLFFADDQLQRMVARQLGEGGGGGGGGGGGPRGASASRRIRSTPTCRTSSCSTWSRSATRVANRWTPPRSPPAASPAPHRAGSCWMAIATGSWATP
jgi:hypothetical protein